MKFLLEIDMTLSLLRSLGLQVSDHRTVFECVGDF